MSYFSGCLKHFFTLNGNAVPMRIGLSLCLSIGVLMPDSSFAATQADIEAAQRQLNIIQRQEQDRIERDQEAARRRTDGVDGMDTQPLMPKITVPAIGAACRDIKTVTITDAVHLSAAVHKHITDEYNGHCLNVADIEQILGIITKDYIDSGYVTTRAYLPAQDLSTGTLEILVIEGVIEKILIKDGNTNSISVLNVFSSTEGDLLNLRDLEQGIDQINRLASNNAQLDIQPGDATGASQVIVYNQPGSPFHYYLSTDNQGSKSTGEVQTGLTFTADNLLGFDDMFSATHRESTPGDSERKFSVSDSFNFSIPFGYTTVSLATSYSRYASTILVPSGQELIASGNNRSDSLQIDRVMYRDQSTRVLLSGSITGKNARNYLDNQFLGVSSRRLTVLDIDANLSTDFAGGLLSLDLGYAQGLSVGGALKDPDNLPDWAPRAQFKKIKAGFNYNRPFRLFDEKISFTSQLSAQKAHSAVYGSEQISIGGLYSVRGFVNNSLSGDDGYYWRNELSVRKPITIGGEVLSARFYAGYDLGEVSSQVDDVPQGRLSGMVVGISTNWRGASLELINTRPLSLPDTMTKESNQTWFRVAYSF
ncbi:ShlB/FhaC/HecB family hemolysin secretion/activation protein [Neptunomonas antarctica]|uniref:Hemolysin activation/secretion protein n=1 Tax=Neptunomonas antarctica TaxID=619304 RepID=A0A1N7PPU8_9GAMM|nr:ShlB/FhaC/HecB family hemolysin secretion/activation protein [Neptunomonas antarctica]SIT12664.1 hemolysin activation/secretion protein [Neptunomonas antarctica]